MQTTLIIYVALWILIALPLGILFVRKMFLRKIGEKPRLRPGVLAVGVLGVAIVTAFLAASYAYTVESRYELAVERYVNLHAQYRVGLLSDDAYRAATTPVRGTNPEDPGFAAFDETLFAAGADSASVRFQTSSWIIPKYFSDNDAFPNTLIIDENNPVFVIYLLDDGTTQTYYTLRLQRVDTAWQVTYQAETTDEQLEAAQSALPSQKNGQWFTVTAP